MTPTRVVIADDHRLFLVGLRNVLDAAEDIVESYRSGVRRARTVSGATVA